MKLIEQITEAWRASKAYRLSIVEQDPHGEYSRLDRLDRLDGLKMKDLP